ncbi:MAG: class I lanthipeptide [Candidatus Aminicenantes bacterium]|nr:MAG: class I lanthipeptide [Candidatus Aminicenantes bacterium]
MKTKTFNKKLSLNKQTIARLENGEIREVLGGSGVESCGGCIPKTEEYITCWCTEFPC